MNWKFDLVSIVRKSVRFAEENEDWKLAKELADVILVMKSDEIDVPPEMLAYAWMISEMVNAGAARPQFTVELMEPVPADGSGRCCCTTQSAEDSHRESMWLGRLTCH